jgi:tRNA(Ile)-lysidine synthetase-like protein
VTNLVARVRDEVARVLTPPPSPPLEERGEGVGMILAVSGGPDSLCLADATLATAPDRSLVPIIAHLDHGLRGEASRADAEFVRTFAEQRGMPCAIDHVDVEAIARERKVSIEVAAREARYAFLARVADQVGAQLVAVAHNADDQAETVLLRLIRGTGLVGLRGMQPVCPMPNAPHLTLVRPLLRISRAETEQYCRDRELHPRQDATNDDLLHMRNRIRHELLPLLERYNPGIRTVLARLADTVASDLDIIDDAVRETFNCITRSGEVSSPLASPLQIEFDRIAWRNLSAGLQRATLREAVRRVKGDVTNLKYAAIEEARDVLNSDASIGEIALMHDVRIKVTWRTFVIGDL